MNRRLAVTVLVFAFGSARAQTVGQQRSAPEVRSLQIQGEPQKLKTPPATPDATEVEEASKEVAIRRLLLLTGATNLTAQMLESAMPQIRSIVGSALPQGEREKFIEDFSQRLRARFGSDDMINAIVPIYARHFSLEDIKALTQFYESSVGQRFVRALPQISKESQAAGAQIGQSAVVDILNEMSSEYPDAKKLLQPENTPSSGVYAPAPRAYPAPAPAANQK